jgi:hypothetical protein
VRPKGEEVRPLGSGHERGDVHEGLEQSVDDLLVHAHLGEFIGVVHRRDRGFVPDTDGVRYASRPDLPVGLHALLVLAPVHRHGGVGQHRLPHLGVRDGTRRRSVPREDTVRHEFRVDETRVRQHERRQAVTAARRIERV